MKYDCKNVISFRYLDNIGQLFSRVGDQLTNIQVENFLRGEWTLH